MSAAAPSPVAPRAPAPARARDPLAPRTLVALAVGVAALHLLANAVAPYGVHRDELLYLAMGRHLRLWAMDFPPFIALAAQVTRALAWPVGGDATLGTSMALLRVLPAVAAGALVLLAACLARALGGGRAAQGLAALAVCASPLYLRAGTLFQPVVFDQLWWTLALFALVRLARTADRTADRTAGRDWLLLGTALGLGLLTKFSVAFVAVGVAAGVLATPLRRTLRTPAPWGAALLAVALGSPSLVGQVRLGWPVVGQMRDLRAQQLVHVGLAEFLGGQLAHGPMLLLAVLGVWGVFARPRSTPAVRTGRAAVIACLVAFGLLLATHGKSYYVGPVYPTLWAAGAVTLADRLGGWTARSRRVTLAGVAALFALFGALTLPLGVPVLPPPAMARYAAITGGTDTNTGDRLALPQDYADMLGWPEQADAVARVFRALSPADQARAALLGGNYGEAGALELYGPARGLPAPVSPAGSYWFWGPGPRAGEVLIVLADSAEVAARLPRLYARVRPVARALPDSLLPWAVPDERRTWIFVCDGARRTLPEVWPGLRP